MAKWVYIENRLEWDLLHCLATAHGCVALYDDPYDKHCPFLDPDDMDTASERRINSRNSLGHEDQLFQWAHYYELINNIGAPDAL